MGAVATLENMFNPAMKNAPITSGYIFASSDINRGTQAGLATALMYGAGNDGAMRGKAAEVMFYGVEATAKKYGITEEALSEEIRNEAHGKERMSQDWA